MTMINARLNLIELVNCSILSQTFAIGLPSMTESGVLGRIEVQVFALCFHCFSTEWLQLFKLILKVHLSFVLFVLL